MDDIEVERRLQQLRNEMDGKEGLSLEELIALRLSEPDEWSVPALPTNPVTKPGDLWVLERHRLLCGDATDKRDVKLLLGKVVPVLMVTDPPYGVNYDSSWRNTSGLNVRDDGTVPERGKVTNDHCASWRPAYELFPGAVAYVWHAGRHAKTVQQDLEDCGFEIINQIIWGKSNFAIGRGDYHWRHEPVWYAVRKGCGHSWQGSRTETTLWQIPKPAKSDTGHSAQKPIECMERPIRNNTAVTDSVYDPFVGSGTTIIAGQRTGRRVFAMDISPAYVDLSLQRWSDLTGLDPVLECLGRENGMTFSALKKETHR